MTHISDRGFNVDRSSVTFWGNRTCLVHLRRSDVVSFHDIELAVFELGRLWVNGTNDLEYTLERLAIHKLTNHAK